MMRQPSGNTLRSVTSAAAQLTLAPPGVNLALNATATSSSSQNACNDGTTTPPFSGTGCLGAENAVDGNLATRALQRALGSRGLPLWYRHPDEAWAEGMASAVLQRRRRAA